jgi:hypothetical protein
MSEPNGQPAPAVAPDKPAPAPSGTPAPAAAPESFINPDGTFKPGWEKAYVPEDFQGLGAFKTFTDIKGAMKQLGNLERLRGKTGKGIMPLTAESTPTERELYYKAIGRPDTPAGYKIEIPKDLEGHYDPAVLEEAKGALHAAGLTQEQVAAVVALDAKRLKDGLAKREAQEKADHDAAEKALRVKWGAAYDARLHVANRMIEENVAAADKPMLLEAIGNNPAVADFLATIGKKFMEDTPPREGAAAAGAMTPAEAKLRSQEIGRELVATPNMRYDNPSKYARLNKELDEATKASLAGGQR